MQKRSIVGAILVLVVGAVASLLILRSGPEATSRDDYCGPAEQVLDLPEVADDGIRVTPSYRLLATVSGALAASAAPDGRVFVATKPGELWQAPVGGGTPTKVLDLTGQVGTKTEQGLLGVAVHPDGAHLYLYATFSDRTARLVEYALTPDGLDEGSARDVITIDDPNPSHNGGRLAFDAEGRLLLGIGDGGDGDVTGASQDLGSLFGKLLRIDPLASGDDAYTIPTDNPFVGVEGASGEVLAYGFRNPWGWALDPATDELFVGDVGQLCREEINVVADQGAGANFGWPFVEGAHEFLGPVLGPEGEPADGVAVVDLGSRPDVVAPVLEYAHSETACSVIGGVVYRGTAVPELDGTYLWADLCERSIRTLRRDGTTWVSGRLGGTIPKAIVAFAQAPDGEVYLLSLDEGLYQISAP